MVESCLPRSHVFAAAPVAIAAAPTYWLRERRAWFVLCQGGGKTNHGQLNVRLAPFRGEQLAAVASSPGIWAFATASPDRQSMTAGICIPIAEFLGALQGAQSFFMYYWAPCKTPRNFVKGI